MTVTVVREILRGMPAEAELTFKTVDETYQIKSIECYQYSDDDPLTVALHGDIET